MCGKIFKSFNGFWVFVSFNNISGCRGISGSIFSCIKIRRHLSISRRCNLEHGQIFCANFWDLRVLDLRVLNCLNLSFCISLDIERIWFLCEAKYFATSYSCKWLRCCALVVIFIIFHVFFGLVCLYLRNLAYDFWCLAFLLFSNVLIGG